MTGLLDLESVKASHPLVDVIAGSGVKLQRVGGEWKGRCPFHSDSSPSFFVYDNGSRWICFAGCGGGDIFDFLGKTHATDLRGAVELLSGSSLPRRKLSSVVDSSRGKPATLDEARAIWAAAEPVGNTLAREYLWQRGLHIEPPYSLRFAVLPYGKSKRSFYPCLVAAITGIRGELQGVQRTFLRADGKAKAEDIPSPRLTLGRVTGGAIRMGPPAGELVLTEGSEDALAIMQSLGRIAWSTCGTSNLGKVKLPEIVKEVVIGADADAPGRAAAKSAGEAYAVRGLKVKIAYPPAPAKDWNEALNMEAAQ